MKGDNQLILNTATIIQAVQEYLDKRWMASMTDSCPKVVDVVANSQEYTFRVSLKSEI
jgi:hypothetical protein